MTAALLDARRAIAAWRRWLLAGGTLDVRTALRDPRLDPTGRTGARDE